MVQASFRKRLGPVNISASRKQGLGASLSLRSKNKKGVGYSYNTKRGLTISLRGTGIRLNFGGGIQNKSKEQRKKERLEKKEIREREKQEKFDAEIQKRIETGYNKSVIKLEKIGLQLDLLFDKYQKKPEATLEKVKNLTSKLYEISEQAYIGGSYKNVRYEWLSEILDEIDYYHDTCSRLRFASEIIIISENLDNYLKEIEHIEPNQVVITINDIFNKIFSKYDEISKLGESLELRNGNFEDLKIEWAEKYAIYLEDFLSMYGEQLIYELKLIEKDDGIESFNIKDYLEKINNLINLNWYVYLSDEFKDVNREIFNEYCFSITKVVESNLDNYGEDCHIENILLELNKYYFYIEELISLDINKVLYNKDIKDFYDNFIEKILFSLSDNIEKEINELILKVEKIETSDTNIPPELLELELFEKTQNNYLKYIVSRINEKSEYYNKINESVFKQFDKLLGISKNRLSDDLNHILENLEKNNLKNDEKDKLLSDLFDSFKDEILKKDEELFEKFFFMSTHFRNLYNNFIFSVFFLCIGISVYNYKLILDIISKGDYSSLFNLYINIMSVLLLIIMTFVKKPFLIRRYILKNNIFELLFNSYYKNLTENNTLNNEEDMKNKSVVKYIKFVYGLADDGYIGDSASKLYSIKKLYSYSKKFKRFAYIFP